MKMKSCTDVQEFLDSREPFRIIETTTTTTTTVTKRICIAADKHIDIADIESLLNQPNELRSTNTVAESDDISKNQPALLFQEETSADDISDIVAGPGDKKDLLSSTKIDELNSIESDEKIGLPLTDPVKTTKCNKSKSKTNKKKMSKPKPIGERLEYIDELINSYLTSKTPPKKVKSKVPELPKTEKIEKIDLPTFEQKDLSAIFEQSLEERTLDSSHRQTRKRTTSPPDNNDENVIDNHPETKTKKQVAGTKKRKASKKIMTSPVDNDDTDILSVLKSRNKPLKIKIIK